MNVTSYLKRINYDGFKFPDYKSLQDLQIHHLLTVPFENLSIHNKEPIVLEEDLLYKKIVLRRRGGFCYELKGLFAALLRDLGYNVSMLSAGVMNDKGEFGPDFDHMTLMVLLEDKWLVDVGFGDSFRQPLLIENRDEQSQGDRSYQIIEEGNYLVLKEKTIDKDWRSQYRFTLNPCKLDDYIVMCNYHQTSPESNFTQRKICSVAKPDGRVTLSNMRLIVTKGIDRQERVLSDESEYKTVLKKEFGITIRN